MTSPVLYLLSLLLLFVLEVFCKTRFKGDPGDLGDIALDLTGYEAEEEVLSRSKRLVFFPSGSTLTISNEFAIPAFSKKDGAITGKLKGTIHVRYKTPYQIILGKRSIEDDRVEAYESLVSLFDSFGINGTSCVQKSVCELAEQPIGEEGLFEQLIEMLLSPNHNLSTARRYLQDYSEAERFGRRQGGCTEAYKSCPVSILDLIHVGTSALRKTVRHSVKWLASDERSQIEMMK